MSAPVSFQARVVLRPRSLDETLDLALAYARRHGRELARLVLPLELGLLAILVAVHALGGGRSDRWGLTQAATLMLAPVLERIVTAYAGPHLFANPTTVRGALGAVARHPAATLASAVLVPLPLLLPLIGAVDEEQQQVFLGLAAVLYLFWPFGLAQSLYRVPVQVLEQLRGPRARKRATGLVGPRFGRALAFVVLTGGLRLFAMGVFEMASKLVLLDLLQLPIAIDRFTTDGGSWATIVGYLAVAPLIALARLFDYVDARTRREGWDIQVRFRAIEARAIERAARRAA